MPVLQDLRVAAAVCLQSRLWRSSEAGLRGLLRWGQWWTGVTGRPGQCNEECVCVCVRMYVCVHVCLQVGVCTSLIVTPVYTTLSYTELTYCSPRSQ